MTAPQTTATPDTLDRIKAWLDARINEEGVPSGPWIADRMTSRFVWFMHDDPDDRIIKVYGGSEAETAAVQKFIARSSTVSPAMAKVIKEEIAWLERISNSKDQAYSPGQLGAALACTNRLAQLVASLEGLLS